MYVTPSRMALTIVPMSIAPILQENDNRDISENGVGASSNTYVESMGTLTVVDMIPE